MPLDRLWLACQEAGLIDVGRSKATGEWTVPAGEEQWRQRGTALLGSLLVHMSPILPRVFGTLLLLLDPESDSVGLGELEQWWWLGHDLALVTAHLAQEGIIEP